MDIMKSEQAGGLVYTVLNDKREEIATFDDLTTAACVLRYLRGGSMGKPDGIRAIAAMEAVDLEINGSYE